MVHMLQEKLEAYYRAEKAIAWNRGRLERLEKRKAEIERDMASPSLPFELQTDLQGVCYDGIGGKGGRLPESPMERNIEGMYRALEQAYEKTQNEMVQVKMKIQQLEDSREEMAN